LVAALRALARALLLLACALILASASPTWAILDVSQLRPGQQGLARTVFSGTTVEEFPLELVEILAGDDPEQDLILVRASGKRIDALGGIAAGMSGSPVYVDGELIGALAYVIPGGDPHYAYVTPARLMLRLLEDDRFAQIPDGLVPIASPVCLGRLSRHAYEAFAPKLKATGLLPVQTEGAVPLSADAPELKPGAAVAVSLMSGDSEAVSLGTCTWAERGQALFFGHSLYQEGLCELPFSLAWIVATLPGAGGPFKIGGGLGIEGTISLDSPWGLLGHTGKGPAQLQLTVYASDANLGRDLVARQSLVKHRPYTPVLAGAAVLDALDKLRMAIGPGACEGELVVHFASGKEASCPFSFSTLSDLTTDFANWLTPMLAQLLAFEGPLGEVTSIDLRVKVKPPVRPCQLASISLGKSGTYSLPVTLEVFDPAGPASWQLDAPLPPAGASNLVLALTGAACLDEDAWLAQGKRLAFEAARKATDAADYLSRLGKLTRSSQLFAEWITPEEWALRRLFSAERATSQPVVVESEEAPAGVGYHPWAPGLTPGPGDFVLIETSAPLLGLAGCSQSGAAND